MKKFFLTAIILMPTLLLAENGVTISGLSVGVGSLTFTVSWDKPAPASTLTWSDTVWVFVDYNNAGVMKRLPLAAGATLTATSAPGIGKVIPVSGNTQGVWVVGNARTTSSFSATVVLPFSGSNVSGACAYASNYPPFGDWNSEGTQLTLTGTAPYTLHLEGPLANDPVILNNVYTLPDGYTLASFTDATGAPGMLHCTPPTAPESLTPSFATVCSGVSVLLTAAGGQEGSNSQFEFGIGTVGTGGTLTSVNTYSVTPTSSTTYWVRRVSIDGCGVTAAATCAVTVTPAFTQGAPSVATICYNTTNTFNLAAPSGGSGAITYLWEQSSNNSDWTTATGTNNAQNYTTPSLTTNTYYRRKAAAATCGGTITTNSALVTVTPTFTQDNPAIASICNNTTHTFNVAVPSGGSGDVTYLWEQSSDNNNWTAADGTNNTQNYTTPQLITNTYYRRKAAAATCGGTITTSSALVTVNGNFTQSDHSVATICYNTTNAFNLAAPSGGSGAVTYLWEQSSNNSDWTTATGTNTTQNYTTPQLTTNTYYRRKAAAATCGGTITTSGALVTVRTNFTSGAITTGSQTINSGAAVSAISSTTAASGGDGTITYKWQRNGGDISGATAAAYTPTNFNATAGTHTFTRWAKDGTCNTWTQSSGSYVLSVRDAGCGSGSAVTIGGVTWACANVAASGAFATAADEYGNFFKWYESVAYANSGTDNTFNQNYPTNSQSTSLWSPSAPPCPTGWRVPTIAEFQALYDRGYTWKSSGFAKNGTMFGSNRANCNSLATMTGECVFLPAAGRRRNYNDVYGQTGECYYWSATGNSTNDVKYFYSRPGSFELSTWDSAKYNGASLRCVK